LLEIFPKQSLEFPSINDEEEKSENMDQVLNNENDDIAFEDPDKV
jgi:hypothetical protein